MGPEKSWAFPMDSGLVWQNARKLWDEVANLDGPYCGESLVTI